eukprot:5137931-Prymnesium_polylepis.1
MCIRDSTTGARGSAGGRTRAHRGRQEEEGRGGVRSCEGARGGRDGSCKGGGKASGCGGGAGGG